MVERGTPVCREIAQSFMPDVISRRTCSYSSRERMPPRFVVVHESRGWHRQNCRRAKAVRYSTCGRGEMADARSLGVRVRKDVGVQVPPPALEAKPRTLCPGLRSFCATTEFVASAVRLIESSNLADRAQYADAALGEHAGRAAACIATMTQALSDGGCRDHRRHQQPGLGRDRGRRRRRRPALRILRPAAPSVCYLRGVSMQIVGQKIHLNSFAGYLTAGSHF